MTIVQRSLLCLVMLMSCSVALFGCQTPSGNQRLFVNSDFAPTTAFGYTPFEFVVSPVAGATAVQGFDAQLAAQLAFRLGFVGAAFHQTPFQNILADVDAGNPQANIAISAISITQDRISNFPDVAFIPYNNDDMALIIPNATFNLPASAGLKNGANALASLNTLAGTNPVLATVFTLIGSRQASRTAAVGTGIISQKGNQGPYPNLQSDPIGITNGQFATIEDAVKKLNSELALGRQRTLFTDTPTALALKQQGFISNFTVVTGIQIDPTLDAFKSFGLGIAVPAECCQLYVNIVKALKDMEDEGVLPAMRAFWGTGSFTPPTVNLTPAGCTATPTINSNRIANYIFTNFCPQTAAIVTVNVGA